MYQLFLAVVMIGFIVLASASVDAEAPDWKGLAIPVDPGEGKVWVLQDNVSDSFNYEAPADEKGPKFRERWDDWYHNHWSGPGLTLWDREHVFVKDGMLTFIASRVSGTKQVHLGCISSLNRVKYPVYVEARAKVPNTVLASALWLLSPCDTREIDFMEAYGADYSANADKDQTWFSHRMHVSHHMFIREPFQDYQPKDAGSWIYKDTPWRDQFHTYAVYWRDPWHLEYYIDGELVRTVSGKDIIDPLNYTEGQGLDREMDIIIDMEDHDWRSKQGITPTDQELSIQENNTFRVDWIRVYNLVKQD